MFVLQERKSILIFDISLGFCQNSRLGGSSEEEVNHFNK